MNSKSEQAWNNFVLISEARHYLHGSEEWAAAAAKRFMGLAHSGGLKFLLTVTHDVDPEDFVAALDKVGAIVASDQFQIVLRDLGLPVPPASEAERWHLLELFWTTELDRYRFLSPEADVELRSALKAHVSANEHFYLRIREELDEF